MSVIYKWKRLSNGEKAYSIRDYERGVCIENFTSAHQAKRAFREATKRLRAYHEQMRREHMLSRLIDNLVCPKCASNDIVTHRIKYGPSFLIYCECNTCHYHIGNPFRRGVK